MQFVAIIYFGSLLVNRGHETAKWYFTCLQIHAARLEVFHSFSTGSFIVAPLRFAWRR